MDATKTHVEKDLTHNSPLISCRFDPTAKFIFAGAQDYSVWRFEVETGKKTQVPTESWVRGMAIDKTGKTLVTGGYDGRLIWWGVADETPKPVRIVEGHKGWVRAVAISPDGSLLASVGNDLAVRLWNMSDGKLVREMSGHESHIYNVAFHPNGKDLATGDLMAHLFHWEVATGKKVRTWQAESLQKFDKTFIATLGGFRGMAFSPDGKFVAASGMTNVTNSFRGSRESLGRGLRLGVRQEADRAPFQSEGARRRLGSRVPLGRHPHRSFRRQRRLPALLEEGRRQRVSSTQAERHRPGPRPGLRRSASPRRLITTVTFTFPAWKRRSRDDEG